jgi:hypothetical protein
VRVHTRGGDGVVTALLESVARTSGARRDIGGGHRLDFAPGMDPALELWVDVGDGTAEIRLAGLLDPGTARPVRAAIEDVVARGCRTIHIQGDDLAIPGTVGISALLSIQRTADELGAKVDWSRGFSVRWRDRP